MKVCYCCPHCSRNTETDDCIEVRRGVGIAIFVCKCALCNLSSRVTVRYKQFEAPPEEKKMIDKFGFSLN